MQNSSAITIMLRACRCCAVIVIFPLCLEASTDVQAFPTRSCDFFYSRTAFCRQNGYTTPTLFLSNLSPKHDCRYIYTWHSIAYTNFEVYRSFHIIVICWRVVTFRSHSLSFVHSLGSRRPLYRDQPETLTQGCYARVDSSVINAVPRERPS